MQRVEWKTVTLFAAALLGLGAIAAASPAELAACRTTNVSLGLGLYQHKGHVRNLSGGPLEVTVRSRFVQPPFEPQVEHATVTLAPGEEQAVCAKVGGGTSSLTLRVVGQREAQGQEPSELGSGVFDLYAPPMSWGTWITVRQCFDGRGRFRFDEVHKGDTQVEYEARSEGRTFRALPGVWYDGGDVVELRGRGVPLGTGVRIVVTGTGI